MANNFGSNPIVLDTFTSAIDVGNSIWGNSTTPIKLQSIEWQVPTTAGHTAAITDGGGDGLFAETCITNNQSIIKYFDGAWVDGIKIAASGVASGKIVINYL